MEKIAVVEAGTVGRIWAIVFARAGFAVSLFDSVHPDGADSLRVIRARLQDLSEFGQLGASQDAVLARISIAPSLAAALDGAVHAQENGANTEAAKIALFARMDALAGPETVLASSTSAISPSAFSEHLPGRHRCLVVHPVQPPYALQAVEVIAGQWTSADVVARSRALVERCGLVPIMIKREAPGYVINSLQIALVCEAFRLVAEGIASAEDCEAAVKYGLGPRWALMGPFETAGVNAPGGIADIFRQMADFYRAVRATQTPVQLTTELIDQVHDALSDILRPDNTAQRLEWRDRQLMALAEFRKSVVL